MTTPENAGVDAAIPPGLVALVLGSRGAVALGREPGGSVVQVAGSADDVSRWARQREGYAARWLVWSSDPWLRGLVMDGAVLDRVWDLAQVHTIIAGGHDGRPSRVWALASGADPATLPQPDPLAVEADDLFAEVRRAAPVDESRWPLDVNGHLPDERCTPDGVRDVEHALALARLAIRVQSWQERALGALPTTGGPPTAPAAQTHPRGPSHASVPTERALHAARSESAAALLCLELERDGLPVDMTALEELLRREIGPRPASVEDELAMRRGRDALVLRHAPEHLQSTDLRNPLMVKEMLVAAGIRVESTRAWHLEPHRERSPLVAALLDWRKRERIATTYGYRWIDEHISPGPDSPDGPTARLRGRWWPSDGGAGRMTADSGLHNLPAVMRPAIAADPGHALVRADLGQIEPRVLAAVSGDPALVEATRADDLYSPVADKLGAPRATAKIAVLAAMYGQRSGAAGEALKDLERAYPVAMRLLDAAYDSGRAQRDLRTYGGRRIPLSDSPVGDTNARGRFARNAIIQGSAAELFKAWASTVRIASRPLGAQVVLCLHDELLVHVPQERAQECADLVVRCLDDAARRWTGGGRTRFVADVSVVRRWSEAKG